VFDFRFVLVCFALAVGSVPASAQEAQVAFGSVKADPSLPVEVTSETLNVNQEDGSAEFLGNVIVVQGEMRLSAPRVLVFYTENQSGVERLQATGGVTLVNGDQAAEAETAEYEVNRGTIRMVGNVLLTQGANTLVSDSMDVDLEAGTALMNGRVRTVFQSGDN